MGATCSAQCLVVLILSVSVRLASTLHSSDFVSSRYSSVYARYSPIKKHSAGRRSLHFYTYTRLVLREQRRNVVLDGSTEQSMRRGPSLRRQANVAENTSGVEMSSSATTVFNQVGLRAAVTDDHTCER
jgi:hypothetical protein